MRAPRLITTMLAACAGLAGCAAVPPTQPPPVKSATTDPVAAAPPALSEAPAPPWPATGNCRALASELSALENGVSVRLDAATAPLGLTVRSPSAAGLVRDLPLPSEDGARRCALLVEIGASVRAAPRRVLGHERVRSTYRVGGAGRTNPEYQRLQRELREAESGSAPAILATGDPGLDLIGLVAGGILGGAAAIVDGRRSADLRRRLASTPPRLDDVAWEPYSFEVTTLEAARRGPVQARLLDRGTGTVWSVEDTILETGRFRVAAGRRARDRGLLEGGGDGLRDAEEVAAWEQSGVQPSLSSLLAALARDAVPTGAADWVIEPAAGPGGSVVAATGPDGVRRFQLRVLSGEP
ncbi:MAG: hypothetical protein U1E52_09015 [Geminicoccaceae bacterium]